MPVLCFFLMVSVYLTKKTPEDSILGKLFPVWMEYSMDFLFVKLEIRLPVLFYLISEFNDFDSVFPPEVMDALPSLFGNVPQGNDDLIKMVFFLQSR